MKYYCIGKPIPLVKLAYSTNFFDNLPVIGTPLFGNLKITQAKMRAAFYNSDTLILCKTLDDAKMLRSVNIIEGNPNPREFFFRTRFVRHGSQVESTPVARKGPVADFAIYEIEASDEINFFNLRRTSIEELKELVSEAFYSQVLVDDESRNKLPDIEVCSMKRSVLNTTLLECHYFSLTDDTDLLEQSSCNLL